MKNIKILSFLFTLLCIGLTSCGDDLSTDTLISTENFAPGSFADGVQRSGSNPCFELVFPITVEFEDGTTATAADKEELKAAVLAWKGNNSETEEADDGERGRGKGYRPDLVFPIQVIDQDGETVDIASQEELAATKEACSGDRGRRGGKGNRGNREAKCFSLIYPLTFDFSDGTSQTFEDAESKREALKAYKEANGRDAERPTLAYPVSVTFEDGSEAIADSMEALQELKNTCSEEGE